MKDGWSRAGLERGEQQVAADVGGRPEEPQGEVPVARRHDLPGEAVARHRGEAGGEGMAGVVVEGDGEEQPFGDWRPGHSHHSPASASRRWWRAAVTV